jgi:hypothetical protein
MRGVSILAGPAVALAALCGPVIAEPLSGAAFDALTRGRTLTYGIGGTPYGVEQYLPGRRVIWAFLGEPCRFGVWTEPEPGMICFVYDHDPGPQCWQFFDDAGDGGRLRARFMGDPAGADLIQVDESDQPMQCPGPRVGV